MGLRLWIGLIQTIERRIGESLGLEPKLARAVDWDKAEEELMDAFERIWGQRSERILQEVASDLEAALRKAERIDKALKIRLLVQMSYGQQTFFDKRTHQRRSVLVARLTYPFYAAGFIAGREPEALAAEVLAHLEGAQAVIERAIGEAEFARLQGSRLSELEEPLQAYLRSNLGP